MTETLRVISSVMFLSMTLLREANHRSLVSLTNQVTENDRATQTAREKEELLLAVEEAKEQARKVDDVAVPYSAEDRCAPADD